MDKSLLNNSQGSSQLIPKHVHGEDSPMKVLDLCQINKRFMGGGMSQSYSALYFFEYYIEHYGFEYIVEIGTQKGALSLFFANMAAVTERFFFDTFDISDEDYYDRSVEGVGHWFREICKISPYCNFFRWDIFSKGAMSRIQIESEDKKTLIFCDGGDKVREMDIYGGILKPGDHIILHDWQSEVFADHIAAILEKHHIKYNHPYIDYCMEAGTLLMPFIKM